MWDVWNALEIGFKFKEKDNLSVMNDLYFIFYCKEDLVTLS